MAMDTAHSGLRKEERIGLAIAAALHVALVAVLLVQPDERNAIPQPERMTVSLAEDVGLEATAPEPVAESRAAQAPTLDDSPAPAPPLEQAAPEPRPIPQIERPRPAPTRATQAQPRRRTETPRSQPRPRPAERSGGSRVGENFLEGAGESTRTNETRAPASQIGASAKASLFQAVGRQLRPHWRPVDGADREKLVSKVRFRLNPDGSLAGAPTLVGQRGVTDANRPQAPRHAENALRAVQLAAPFDLPEEYYEAWKLVTVDFDWKLSQ